MDAFEYLSVLISIVLGLGITQLLLGFARWLEQPVVLFLLASVVFPGSAATKHDLREHFREQRPWFFGLFMGLVVVSLVKDLVRGGALPDGLNLGFHVVLLGLAGGGMATEKDRMHRVIAYAALALFVVYIAVLFADL